MTPEDFAAKAARLRLHLRTQLAQLSDAQAQVKAIEKALGVKLDGAALSRSNIIAPIIDALKSEAEDFLREVLTAELDATEAAALEVIDREWAAAVDVVVPVSEIPPVTHARTDDGRPLCKLPPGRHAIRGGEQEFNCPACKRRADKLIAGTVHKKDENGTSACGVNGSIMATSWSAVTCKACKLVRKIEEEE